MAEGLEVVEVGGQAVQLLLRGGEHHGERAAGRVAQQAAGRVRGVPRESADERGALALREAVQLAEPRAADGEGLAPAARVRRREQEEPRREHRQRQQGAQAHLVRVAAQLRDDGGAPLRPPGAPVRPAARDAVLLPRHPVAHAQRRAVLRPPGRPEGRARAARGEQVAEEAPRVQRELHAAVRVEHELRPGEEQLREHLEHEQVARARAVRQARAARGGHGEHVPQSVAQRRAAVRSAALRRRVGDLHAQRHDRGLVREEEGAPRRRLRRRRAQVFDVVPAEQHRVDDEARAAVAPRRQQRGQPVDPGAVAHALGRVEGVVPRAVAPALAGDPALHLAGRAGIGGRERAAAGEGGRPGEVLGEELVPVRRAELLPRLEDARGPQGQGERREGAPRGEAHVQQPRGRAGAPPRRSQRTGITGICGRGYRARGGLSRFAEQAGGARGSRGLGGWVGGAAGAARGAGERAASGRPRRRPEKWGWVG